MRLRLVRNVAFVLLAGVGIATTPSAAYADGCTVSPYPAIGSLFWYDCPLDCSGEKEMCDDWCGFTLPDNLHYFLCTPNPDGTNGGFCNCNGGDLPG
jgi:hypothetical protein